MNVSELLTDIFMILNRLEMDTMGNEVASDSIEALRYRLTNLRLLMLHNLNDNDLETMEQEYVPETQNNSEEF